MAHGTLFGTAPRTMWPNGAEMEFESEYEIFQRFYENDQSAENPNHLRMFKATFATAFTYGFSRDFAVRLHTPVAYATRSDDLRGRTSYAGLEDWDISASYRLDPLIFGQPYVFQGGFFRIATFAKLRLPTAENRFKDDPNHIVFGQRGTFGLRWGVQTALSTTWQYWWSEASVTYDTEKDGYQQGMSAKTHLAFGHRLWELGDYRDADMVLLAEGDFEYRDHGRINGMHNPNSGYVKTHLGLGIQLNLTNIWEFKIGYNIPLYRKFYGRQFVHEGELAFAVSYLF